MWPRQLSVEYGERGIKMDFETILYEKEEGVGIIRLNRPKSLNALNPQMIAEISRVFDEIRSDDEVGAVIITGSEKFFCAGADIKAIKEIATPVDTYYFVAKAHAMYNKIEDMDKPVIAAISGLALGGGCELALACDFRLAAENATFGLPEIKIGVLPGGGGTQRLPRLIGISRAKELLYTGNSIDAMESYRIGLVNKVYPVPALMDEAKKMARLFIERPAFSIKMIKTAVNEGMKMDLRTALAYENRCFELIFSTDDQKEGMNAFVEKRKAVFRGR